MNKSFRNILVLLCACFLGLGNGVATESLRPVAAPRTFVEYAIEAELDEDVYSGDLSLSAEYTPCDCFGIYLDGAYRMLSYSYEYSTEGYIHNYANLHVSGFNETYLGFKTMVYRNFGVDVNWRFPPGEGSQKNRFHRLNVEPYGVFPLVKNLELGVSFRYNTFLEDKNYKPGDELGLKASVAWRPFDEPGESPLWVFSGVALFQARIEESENHNMKKAYQKMDDIYQGFKMKLSVRRYFDFMKVPFGVGMDYEIHTGTLFGFETGHRIGVHISFN